MVQKYLPLSRPAIDEQDINNVIKVLKSGWITTGKQNVALEQSIREHTHAPYAVAVSSATAAMHLVLTAFNIGPGDEVITPSLTWVSTVNLIVLMGAKPVFVDIDPDTLMTSAELIRPLITSQTKLIIPVHYAGAPLDLEPIYALGEQTSIPIIEDAAHALGSEYQRRPIGESGTCIFSLHAIKNITSAEGGVLTTSDPALAERIRRLKFHGLAIDTYEREHQGRLPQAEVVEPGYKYNLPDICAALALGQMTRIDDIINKRQMLATLYQEQLQSLAGITPLSLPEYQHKHCWHLFIVRVDPVICGINRDQLIIQLKEHNIGSGIHFKACHSQKYYRDNYQEKFGPITDPLTHTQRNSEQICSLPLFPDMTATDVKRVVNTLTTLIKGNQ